MGPQRRRRADNHDDDAFGGNKRLRGGAHIGSKRTLFNSESTMSSFSEKRCLALFQEYTSVDEPRTMGPEAMEKFCEDIGVEPENIVMLVLAWKMGAKHMGFFSEEEWLHGLSSLQCDTIQKIQGKLDYLKSLLNDQNHFKSIYRYAYDFARDKDQRSMDMATAKAMLQLLLGKHWPLCASFHQFLERACSANFPISGPILEEKAKEIATRMGIEDFRVSDDYKDNIAEAEEADILLSQVTQSTPFTRVNCETLDENVATCREDSLEELIAEVRDEDPCSSGDEMVCDPEPIGVVGSAARDTVSFLPSL
ncbi:hypothetical protein HPB51_017083 [Rhipicephalus microplus]|uniref:Defective in cullin neddylation protein n=1 Tax=Rhipicephalus microplus TaxID=6941 RepID=A0A9J6F498_RHIMP|nr:hypothetical protein HPB51_017083 [Rhipicephalus microplus]